METLIFAVIAGFLLFRLWSVFGKRHGDERQRQNPFERKPDAPTPAPDAAADRVIPFPKADRPREVDIPTDGPLSLAQQVALLQRADPTFSEAQFLGGARAAFTMILDAYAKADLETLKMLLSDKVYSNFSHAIADRTPPNSAEENRLEKLLGADLLEIRLDGSIAKVTVRFASEQKDEEGVVEVTDLWTFERDTRTSDPNWKLVATRAS